MSVVLLDDIPFEPDVEWLMQHLHIKPDSYEAGTLAEMVDAASDVARPKALYRVGTIRHQGTDKVLFDDVLLTSRVLRVNLDGLHRAFVFVVTCGLELAVWAANLDGALEQFWADTLMGMAFRTAVSALKEHVCSVYEPGDLSAMNPGSLDDWPLSEQTALFALLDDPRERIGVQLTDNYLMQPGWSSSGILFAAEESFENCQLCPLEDCPGRRAQYDSTLYARKFA